MQTLSGVSQDKPERRGNNTTEEFELEKQLDSTPVCMQHVVRFDTYQEKIWIPKSSDVFLPLKKEPRYFYFLDVRGMLQILPKPLLLPRKSDF